jgi:hypothetical protein
MFEAASLSVLQKKYSDILIFINSKFKNFNLRIEAHPCDDSQFGIAIFLPLIFTAIMAEIDFQI